MTLSKRIQVLLADDHTSFREAVAASVSRSGSIEVVGQAADGETVVTLARNVKPDVVLMDFRMPILDGAAAAVRILQDAPHAIVLMASLSYERQYLLRSLAAGARGYICKDDVFVYLEEAIESAASGAYYLSPTVQQSLRTTAPENPISIRQRVMQEFDSEGAVLLSCARRLAGSEEVARLALLSAFQAYALALREGEAIPPDSVQTWLVLSIAALANPRPREPYARWAFWQEHPADSLFAAYWFSELENARRAQLLHHVAGCGSCRLAWSLAAFSISADSSTSTVTLRSELANALDRPDEAAMFLAYAQRQFKVMQLASSELERLLGATAQRDWSHRQAAAGSWLGALLGKSSLGGTTAS